MTVAALSMTAAVRSIDGGGDLHLGGEARVLPTVEAVLLRAGPFEVVLPAKRVVGVRHEGRVGRSVLARLGEFFRCWVRVHAPTNCIEGASRDAHGGERLAFAAAST